MPACAALTRTCAVVPLLFACSAAGQRELGGSGSVSTAAGSSGGERPDNATAWHDPTTNAGTEPATGPGTDAATSAGATSAAAASSSSGPTFEPDPRCPPERSDDTCQVCVKALCCDEYLACAGDDHCACLVECVYAMGFAQLNACLAACGYASAPSAEAVSLSGCQNAHCGLCEY